MPSDPADLDLNQYAADSANSAIWLSWKRITQPTTPEQHTSRPASVDYDRDAASPHSHYGLLRGDCINCDVDYRKRAEVSSHKKIFESIHVLKGYVVFCRFEVDTDEHKYSAGYRLNCMVLNIYYLKVISKVT